MASNKYSELEHFMLKTARVQTTQKINEYFGIAVISEPRMAKRRS